MIKIFPLLRTALAALLFFTGLAGCSKHSATAGPEVDCITQTATLANQPEVDASDLNTIKGLFAANNLDATQYHFTSFEADIYTDSTKTAGTQVDATPIVNGLPVFESFDLFVFISSELDTAYLTTAKASSTDTSGNQSLENLRSAFLQHAAESKFISSISTNIGNPDQVKDSCLIATLGYIDAASEPGSTVTFGTRLIKVWAVSPTETSFPEVYIDDATGVAWGKVFIAP